MGVLVISPEIEAKIEALVYYAESNHISMAEMTRRVGDKNMSAVGMNPNRTLQIPTEYRCTYSIEQHPGGWYRHASVSSDRTPSPHPAAVFMIVKMLGFKSKSGLEVFTFQDFDHMETEEFEPGKFAINLLQRYP